MVRHINLYMMLVRVLVFLMTRIALPTRHLFFFWLCDAITGRARSCKGSACPDRVLVAHSGLSGACSRLHLPQDAAAASVLELAAATAFHA